MSNNPLKAIAVVVPSNVPPEVKISLMNEEISFSISRFGRDSFQKPEYDVFEQINQFWADLPVEIQVRIFNIYKEIQQAYDLPYNKAELTEFLTIKSTELLDLHNLQLINDWVSFRSNIAIPERFANEYVHSIDNNTSREKTYTRSDYKDLIGLSLCLRCMIPIWGDYITMTRHETGNEFKEFYAFQLISRSSVMHSSPMIKLRTYIEGMTVDKHTPDNVLKGISSEDFVYWLLALLCIKRLTIADIRGNNPTADAITYVYKFIVQKVQNRDNNFDNSYKEKRFDDKGPGNQENKISTLEKYKIKTNISPVEIVELEFSMRDMYNVASKLTSRINKGELDTSLTTCQVLNDYQLLDPQLLLLSWVFKPVISPRGLMYLPKQTIVNALGTLESVLWARGHEYLALLSTCHLVVSDKEMIVSPVDSKMRMPKEISEEIEMLYPFTRPAALRKQKTANKSPNITLDAIDNLADSLTMYSWKTTASLDRVERVLGNSNRRFLIKPDIKTYIGKLIVEIGSGSWI